MTAVPEIAVLRKSCTDEETCPAITEVSTDLEHLYAIVELVSDEAILAAHRDKMAPHEVLVRFPRSLAPEVTAQ